MIESVQPKITKLKGNLKLNKQIIDTMMATLELCEVPHNTIMIIKQHITNQEKEIKKLKEKLNNV